VVALTAALHVELPLALPSAANLREHWAARHRRVQRVRGLVYQAVAAALGGRRPALPLTVLLVRISPRALDDDNLRGALKAAQDGTSDALGVDDRDPQVTWLQRQEKGRPRQRGLRISLVPP